MTSSYDVWDAIIFRVVKETGENYQSLKDAPLSYLLKLSEGLDQDCYIKNQLDKIKAKKEQEMAKQRR